MKTMMYNLNKIIKKTDISMAGMFNSCQ